LYQHGSTGWAGLLKNANIHWTSPDGSTFFGPVFCKAFQLLVSWHDACFPGTWPEYVVLITCLGKANSEMSLPRLPKNNLFIKIQAWNLWQKFCLGFPHVSHVDSARISKSLMPIPRPQSPADAQRSPPKPGYGWAGPGSNPPTPAFQGMLGSKPPKWGISHGKLPCFIDKCSTNGSCSRDFQSYMKLPEGHQKAEKKPERTVI